jgi:hypothetical protein
MTEEEKAETELIERMLKSVTCHGEEDIALWTVLDVQFELPRELILESRKLLVGRSHMFFSSKAKIPPTHSMIVTFMPFSSHPN